MIHRLRQYSRVHEQKLLQAEVEMLKFALSDQNLELLPDYEQRIAVLKDLKFIDENSTVLLKGRVACEVRIARCVLTETTNLSHRLTQQMNSFSQS